MCYACIHCDDICVADLLSYPCLTCTHAQVANLLNRYLGKYIEGLNKDSLRVAVWGGVGGLEIFHLIGCECLSLR